MLQPNILPPPTAKLAAYMMLSELPAPSIPWQITMFGLVGVANTAVDFVIYNLLTRRIPRIPAIRSQKRRPEPPFHTRRGSG